jgi:hypothetical protein
MAALSAIQAAQDAMHQGHDQPRNRSNQGTMVNTARD